MRFVLHPKILEKHSEYFKATWLNIITYELSFKTMVYEMCLRGSVLCCFLYCRRKTNVIETAGVYFAGLRQEVPHRISVVAVLENSRAAVLV